MRVLILGASGSIGSGIAAELKSHGHQIIALARSEGTNRSLRRLGYDTVLGNLRAPNAWAHLACDVDAIIQVAATFTADMGDVDRAVIEALCDAAKGQESRPRLIYTGGCWLYGETGDLVASEATTFNPIAPFSWMVENARHLVETDIFSTAVIHPASVYHEHGGVFGRFIESAKADEPIEVWGSADVRWPIVHRDDLAVAYRHLLEQRDLLGHYNVSAEDGVLVVDIAKEIAARLGQSKGIVFRTKDDVMGEYGDWAEGPTLSQQMSSKKLREATGWKANVADFRMSDVLR